MATWEDTAIPMLRVWLNDLGTTPTYSDELLKRLLATAAFTVQGEVRTNAYTIDFTNLTLSPDPVAENDMFFTNLVVLKAACISDQGAVRSKAAAQGVRASLGPASIQVSGDGSAFAKILQEGPCAAYKLARVHGGMNASLYHIIIGPSFTEQTGTRNYRP